MPRAKNKGIELEYEVLGDAADPVVLLISGLGSQLLSWADDFCEGLIDRGFCVIRFDNRDVGLSTKVDTDIDVMAAILSVFAGEDVAAPFDLWDMAADAASVLDHAGVDAAHVVGVSMGGMIAQSMAIRHPDRVRSLTSIMSTTGEPGVGQPDAEVVGLLLEATPTEREAAIARAVEVSRAIGSPDNFEEERALDRATRAHDRCFYPAGTTHQLLGIAVSGSRDAALRELEVDTLVIHGDCDPLVGVSGGEHTAEVVPGAELLIIEGMGHDLPTSHWAAVIEAITALAARSASA